MCEVDYSVCVCECVLKAVGVWLAACRQIARVMNVPAEKAKVRWAKSRRLLSFVDTP